ncbi:hypothetical protein ACFLWZ_06860 [Chloroflexota bacterium]
MRFAAIFYPLLFRIGFGGNLNGWVRERELKRPHTVSEILACAGLMIHWESPETESLATAMFMKQPMSEIRELLARAGL